MSKGIKCRSILNSKVIKAIYWNKYFFDSNENSFKIKMDKKAWLFNKTINVFRQLQGGHH